MNNEALTRAVTNLLYELQNKNWLDIYIIDRISHEFDVDALSICEESGITYNIN